MSRAKIQKKSMFIDMTAMSDVTVLLLTFFMLTASFVKKEPVQVVTPASVSEIKIPETNIMSILVGPDGKIFMSLDKQSDMAATLEAMGKEYGLSFTPQEIKKFSLCQTFGVPISHMKSFLALSTEQQDRTLKTRESLVTVSTTSSKHGCAMHVPRTMTCALPSRPTSKHPTRS